MSINGKAYIVGAFEHPTRKADDKSVAQLHAEVARGALDGQTAPQIVAGVDQWTAKFGTDAVDKAFEVKRELGNVAR